MGEFRYPLAITPTRYVTEVGGRSKSLEKNQIGLHIGALVLNTSLSLEDDILVDKAEGVKKPCPVYTRTIHRIKPITELHDSRNLAKAGDGEAVLSQEDPLEVDEGDENNP